jgi:TatD DNase family protein
MLIDTHAHLNFDTFKDDADEVIRRSLTNNIWMINVGTNFESSKKAVEIAEKYKKGVYAAIGLHPIDIDKGFGYEKYKNLAMSKKVVAIGEIGLDYWKKPKTKKKLAVFKEKQKEIFLKQLKLAKELNLPIIIHCRMALDDLLKILDNYLITKPFSHFLGVIHCFTGNWQQAKKFMEMGFYIGFNGIIFKKIEGINFTENIKRVPLDKILIETDCPYLTPPIRVNQRLDPRKSASTIRNNPLGVKFIADYIAKIKNLNYEEIAEATTKNAKKLFQI